MATSLRLLISDDSEDDALLLLQELRKGGLQPSWKRVDSADALKTALASQEWDIIVSDCIMQSFSGMDALQMVKESCLNIPFIIVSGKIDDETAVQMMRAGASDYISKDNLVRLAPVIERELREAAERHRCRQVEEMLRKSQERFRIIAEAIDEIFWMTDAQRKKILYISPGYEHIWGCSRENLYENGCSFRDIVHPDDRQRMLADVESGHIGRTFDHEYRIIRPDGVERWIWERCYPVRDETGAITYHVGVARDISDRKEKERTQADLLRSQVFCDSLTGLANRRRFDESLASEWLRCKRQEIPLALLMIDVDHFKNYNDSYGHQAGDACLQEVAAVLKGQMGRSRDLIARYGGEEFACLLPDTDMDGAMHKGRAIVRAVRERGIKHSSFESASVVTVSLGVAVTVPGSTLQPDEMLSVADEQLYEAKRKGRNRVCGREINRIC